MIKIKKYAFVLSLILVTLLSCEEDLDPGYSIDPPQIQLDSPKNDSEIVDIQELFLSWQFPGHSRSVTLSYVLYYSDDTTQWQTVEYDSDNSSKSYNLSEYCEQGKKYYWKVEAQNMSHSNPEWDATVTLDPTLVSSAINHFYTSIEGVGGLRDSSGDQFVTLMWNDPENIDHIEITYQPENGVVSDPITVLAGEQKKNFTGLDNEVIYTFTVKSVSNYESFIIDTIKSMPIRSTLIYDGDFNIYNTFTVNYSNGEKATWMQENLRTTKYLNGNDIPVDANSSWGYMGGVTIHIDQVTKEVYYSNPLASKGGICPKNYHVPSDEDWQKLETYLGFDLEETEEYFYTNTWDDLKDSKNYSRGSGKSIAPILMTEGSWTNGKCAPDNFIIPFFAEPVGYLRNGTLDIMMQDTVAFFMTSSSFGHRGIHDDSDGIIRTSTSAMGGSIRCVKNN